MAGVHEIATADGRLQIASAVLGVVASSAALRCPGVVALGARNLGEELAGLWPQAGERELPPHGAEVNLEGERCRVSVDLIIAFGSPIQDVCRAVMRAVGEALRSEAGLGPVHVDVRVVGVRPQGDAGSVVGG